MSKYIGFGLEENLPATGTNSKTLYITTDTFKIFWSNAAGQPLRQLGGTSLTKASDAQMQAATDDEAYVTPVKAQTGWLYWIANKTIAALNTTAKTIVGAINELVSSISNHITNHPAPTNRDTRNEVAGAAASAVSGHESAYNHNNFQPKPAEGAFVDGDKTKLNNIATAATANAKATGAEIAAATDDAKFATPKALKDSGKVWVSENAFFNYNSTDSSIDIEFTS